MKKFRAIKLLLILIATFIVSTIVSHILFVKVDIFRNESIILIQYFPLFISGMYFGEKLYTKEKNK